MADLMWIIYDTCMNMSFLNLSYNILPTQTAYRKRFLESLIRLVTESDKLVDLDISGMNLRHHVREIMWPLARSRTLQSIHLSDNNINAVTMTHIFLVFGIKDPGDKIDLDSVTGGALDAPMPRTMTSRQLEMQRIEEKVLETIGAEEDGEATVKKHRVPPPTVAKQGTVRALTE